MTRIENIIGTALLFIGAVLYRLLDAMAEDDRVAR